MSYAAGLDTLLINAREIYTDMGHVIAVGLAEIESGVHHLPTLRRVADRQGAFLILAHPFRFLFDPHGIVTRNVLFTDPSRVPATPEEALSHPAFALVHEIEAVNGASNDRENRFASEAARLRGTPGTGGSDAHSHHGLARGATFMQGDIRNERDLLDALRAGSYAPLERNREGNFFPV
ncbi:MAG TPA: PHP-associated domain-containing protein [Dehalococcoidia bacterium]